MNKKEVIAIFIIISIMLVGIVSTVGLAWQNKQLLSENQQLRDSFPEAPREFNSLSELNTWLWQDKTDEHPYIPITYDCEDFAMDLTDNAREDGYLIYTMGSCTYSTSFVKIYDYCDGHYCYWHWEYVIVDLECHAFCVAKINNYWYKIEPQSDQVSLIGTEF